MEWLADRWGRQMRYGEPPTDPEAPLGHRGPGTRVDLYASLLRFADDIATYEDAVEEVERAERTLSLEASDDARTRLARVRTELQAVRREILSVMAFAGRP